MAPNDSRAATCTSTIQEDSKGDDETRCQSYKDKTHIRTPNKAQDKGHRGQVMRQNSRNSTEAIQKELSDAKEQQGRLELFTAVLDDASESCKDRRVRNELLVAKAILSSTGGIFEEHNYLEASKLAQFAIVSGDLSTAMNAYKIWKTKTFKGEKVARAWCQTYHVREKVMREIEFKLACKAVLKDTDYDVSGVNLTRALISSLPNHVCVYLGHDDLGYYNVFTKETFTLCSCSSTRLLLSRPYFAFCYENSDHRRCQGAPCHSVIAVDDRHGLLILKEAGMKLVDDKRVTLIRDMGNLGVQGIREFQRRFNLPETGLKARLEELSPGAPFVFDYAESVRKSGVGFYAVRRYHDVLRTEIRKVLLAIRDDFGEETIALPYPDSLSDCRLAMGPGLVCAGVLVPGEPCAMGMTTEDLLREDPHIVFDTDVRISLSILPNPEQGNHEECDHIVQAMGVVKVLLGDLCGPNWCISDACESHYSPEIELHLVFKKYISAKRAVSMLSEARKSGIPLTVTNEACVRMYLRSFQIHVSREVWPIVESIVRAKLENFRLSKKYQLEYKCITDDDGSTLIQACAPSQSIAEFIMQRFRGCLDPTVLPIRKRLARHLASIQGMALMRESGEGFGVVVCLREGEKKLLVYGPPKAKQQYIKAMHLDVTAKNNAREKPFGIQSGDFWERIGCFNKSLPADLLLRLSRSVDVKKVCSVSGTMISFHEREIYYLGERGRQGEVRKTVEDTVQELLEDHSLPSIDGSQQIIWEDEMLCCVVCYTSLLDQPYITEVCGHTYCMDCLNTQVTTAVKNNIWPLECAECCTPFTIADIRNIIGTYRQTTAQRLLKSSLAHFMSGRTDRYRYCPKQNCEGVYVLDPSRNVTLCSFCCRRACPLCFERYHKGMTCQEYSDSHLSILAWLKENSRQRKQCRNCSMGIEKYDGCNNVYCLHCKRYMCWVCLAFYTDATQCYQHLDATGHWTDPQ